MMYWFWQEKRSVLHRDRDVMMDYFKNLPEGERPQRPGGRNRQMNSERPAGQQKMEKPDNIKRVWIKEDDIIKPARIETGVTDGINIQIVSGLNEGDEVVTSMEKGTKTTVKAEKNEKKEETQKSPFVPERPGRPGR